MPDYDNSMKWYDFIISKNIVPWVIVVILIFIIFKYSSQLQLMVASVQRLFGSINVNISKKSIENEINARVIKASQKVNKELEEVLPYSIKIQWVKESNRKAFFDDNRVIVCMDHNRTRNQNIVYAISDYIDHGLLPSIKNHINEGIMESSRLILTKKLITLSYKKGLNYFIENIFLAVTEKDENIKQIVEELTRLDEGGMFIQILLREYIDKGKKYATGIILNDFKEETKSFMYFLYEIANRDPHEINTLEFIGKYFKVGIILVADSNVYSVYKEKAYSRRFGEKLKLGVDNIYLFSRGDLKVEIALKVSNEIKELYSEIESPKVFYYKGRYKNCNEYKGICIAYNNIDDTILSKYKQNNRIG